MQQNLDGLVTKGASKQFGALVFCLFTHAIPLKAESLQVRKIPDEYESVGGHGLGHGDSGVAIAGGTSAVRLNPSMLAQEKQYAFGGDYHWPSRGREFYQMGVVDSKTSPIAAGFTYTGFAEDYDGKKSEEIADSPVIRRLSLGLAQSMGKVALGINGQWVEAFDKSDVGSSDGSRVKGTTFGFGATSLATSNVRVAASVENLANKRVKDYAPRTIRAGGALLLAGGQVNLHLEYRFRDRLNRFEGAPVIPVSLRPAEDEDGQLRDSQIVELKPEQMMTGSFSARIYDYLRVLGAYGQALTDDRKSLSGGLAVVSNRFSLSYSASRPYLDSSAAHQAVHLNVSVAL